MQASIGAIPSVTRSTPPATVAARRERRPGRLKLLFGILLWGCLWGGAGAEPLPWYTVEIIVFEHLGGNGEGSESWSDDPGWPAIQESIELSEALPDEGRPSPCPPGDGQCPPTEDTLPGLADIDGGPRAFQTLSRAQFRLTEIERLLKRIARYRPLLHVSWRQPGFPKSESQAVHIRTAGTSLPFRPAAGHNEDAFLDPGTTAAVSQLRAPEVEGVVRLHLARYLHVDVDLLYFRPSSGAQRIPVVPEDGTPEWENKPPAAVSPPWSSWTPERFRIEEQRRVRLKEIHYFDHPLFGLLAQVTRFELPTPKPETPATVETAPATSQ